MTTNTNTATLENLCALFESAGLPVAKMTVLGAINDDSFPIKPLSPSQPVAVQMSFGDAR